MVKGWSRPQTRKGAVKAAAGKKDGVRSSILRGGTITLSRRHRAMRLGEAIDKYIETVLLTKRRRPDGTLRYASKDDVRRTRQIEAYLDRDTPITTAAKLHVIADLNFALMKRMQPQSANRYLSMLRAVLNKAYQWGELPNPPTVMLNREQRPANRSITPLEERRLVKTVPDPLRDLVVFILDTGARRSEAFWLTWDRVDLNRKPRPVVYFTETKTGEHRCVPLPKRTARMLRRRKKKQGHRSKLVFAYEAERDIYTNRGKLYARKGQMIRMSNFQGHWRRLREKVGNVDIRMHDLRHTYASKLVSRGVPLADVGKLLGHRTMESTMRYAYLAIDQLDRAVSVLDD